MMITTTDDHMSQVASSQMAPQPYRRIDPHHEIATAFAKHGHLAAAGTTSPFLAEQPKRIPVTLATMPRWIEIDFPRRLLREIGRDGIAVPTYKLLQWATETTTPIQAEYFGRLAEMLRDDLGTPPKVETGFEYLLGQLTNTLHAAKWAALSEVQVSAESLQYLHWYADVVRRDLLEFTCPDVCVSLPEDVLPIGPTNIQDGHYTCISKGRVLKYLAGEIEAENPLLAARLRHAVDAYYLDDKLVIEVVTPTGDSFWLHSFCSEEEPGYEVNPGQLEYVPGSVDVVNYEDCSRYSRYDHELPYRIFRFWTDDDQ